MSLIAEMENLLPFTVVPYLIGSIPFGVLIGKMRGVDPRTVGSGNIGATNVKRALGTGWAAVVLILDMSKGLIPASLALAFWGGMRSQMSGGEFNQPGFDGYVMAVTVGIATMVGHNWSIFLRGRGGKGASTGFGVVLALDWRVGVLIALVMIVSVLSTRYVSVGSTLGAWFVPLGMWWWHRGTVEMGPLLVFGLMAALLITFKHRSNYIRLMNGTEAKFGKRADEDLARVDQNEPSCEQAPVRTEDETTG